MNAQSGAIGDLLSLEARVLIPGWAFKGDDIRFNATLAGGTMMDAVRGLEAHAGGVRLNRRLAVTPETAEQHCLSPASARC